MACGIRQEAAQALNKGFGQTGLSVGSRRNDGCLSVADRFPRFPVAFIVVAFNATDRNIPPGNV